MIPLFYVVAGVIVVLVAVLVHLCRRDAWGSLLAIAAVLLGVIALLGWGLVCLLWMPWALGGGA